MTSQDKRQPALTDLDKMPFGKYKDELLQDVPCSYLMWLYDQQRSFFENLSKNNIPFTNNKLYNYIHNSMDAIKMELKSK